MLLRDKRDMAIICMLCPGPHLRLMFSVLCKKICLKESEGWCKVISSRIIVTLLTQGLPSSLLYHPVAY